MAAVPNQWHQHGSPHFVVRPHALPQDPLKLRRVLPEESVRDHPCRRHGTVRCPARIRHGCTDCRVACQCSRRPPPATPVCRAAGTNGGATATVRIPDGAGAFPPQRHVQQQHAVQHRLVPNHSGEEEGARGQSPLLPGRRRRGRWIRTAGCGAIFAAGGPMPNLGSDSVLLERSFRRRRGHDRLRVVGRSSIACAYTARATAV